MGNKYNNVSTTGPQNPFQYTVQKFYVPPFSINEHPLNKQYFVLSWKVQEPGLLINMWSTEQGPWEGLIMCCAEQESVLCLNSHCLVPSHRPKRSLYTQPIICPLHSNWRNLRFWQSHSGNPSGSLSPSSLGWIVCPGRFQTQTLTPSG